MAKRKLSPAELLRAISSLKPYPAMFTPAQSGFEVVFPQLPQAGIAYGVEREQAEQAGVETFCRDSSPRAASCPGPPTPNRLIPDEDEPAGTVLVMLKPDKKAIERRLGLKPAERDTAMAAALGQIGKYQ